MNSSKDIITLALDPSTKSTGWALFEGTELTGYGVITAGSSNLFHRIDKIIEGLSVIIKEYKPTKVVIEDVIPEDVKHNQNVFNALKYLQGYILHTLDDYKLTDYKFFTASEWRSKCGITTGIGVRRESLKPQDIAFVKRYYNIVVNDDIADAICIGYAATNKPIPTKLDLAPTIVDGFEFR